MHESAFLPLAVPRVGHAPVDARAETARARTRGYADGYAEGLRTARDEAARERLAAQEILRLHEQDFLRERASALAALERAQSELVARTSQLSAVAIEQLQVLAIELAVAVVGVELSDPGRSAAHAMRRALDELPADGRARVLFSERDHHTLGDALRDVDAVASATVDLGGALVEIDDGIVDARITQAFERAQVALRGVDGQAGEVPA